jgi:sugar phosphate isomerase/epimerase
MKLGLINSAWFGSPIGTEEGIRKTKEIGFDTIDILADPHDMSPIERRSLRKLCEEVGLPVRSVPVIYVGLIDINRNVREFSLQSLKDQIDWAVQLEAHNVLLVLGEYIWQKDVIPPETQWGWAVENTRKAAEYAQENGIVLTVELEPFELSLVGNMDEMVRFLDDVDHPACLANMDCSHLHLARQGADEIRRLKGRIGHVHFSDNDGKKHGDLPPGRGSADLEGYLRVLDDVGFDGSVTIELEFSPEPDRILEWVTEAYDYTDGLMQKLGVRDGRG